MSTTTEPNQSLFRSEYELELEAWLRRRMRWVFIAYGALGAVVTLVRSILIVASDHQDRVAAALLNLAAGVAILWLVFRFLMERRWREATRDSMLRGVSRMILYMGAIALLRENILLGLIGTFQADYLIGLFFWHLVACLLLPWSPMESIRAFLPLVIIWAAEILFFSPDEVSRRVLTVLFGPLILVPGLAVAAMRLHWHSEQFRTRMVGKLFTSMRQELMQARHIHESMFPARHDDGHVRFDFSFRPMHELGGDYVHLHVGPTGFVYLTLLDVTGHGLAAALTVNRLYGELERIRAENPHAGPGEVLDALNRYIYLTMSRHQIFVTGMCLSIDPYLGRLQWASAGHPPAFRRGANGTVMQLPATTVLLGALGPEEFVPAERSLDLTPGDVIVLYTDGAFEARDRVGNQLGIPRLADMLSRHPAPRNWSQHIEAAVVKHSGGRTADDVLIASLTFVALRQKSLVEPAAAAS